MAKRKVEPTIAEITAWANSRGIDVTGRTPAQRKKADGDRQRAVVTKARRRQAEQKKVVLKNTVKAGKGEPYKKKTQVEKKKLADEALVRQITGEDKPTGGARKGHGFETLEEGQGKGRQAAVDTQRADNESESLGEKREEKKSFLLRTLDNISRPLYGTAQAVNRNQEEFWQSRSEGEGMLESLGDGLRKGVTGFGEGATLKKKTTFSKVIQEVADNRKALSQGKQAKDSVSGSAKVNPFLKHGLGLTLDIFADPLTYTGVGLVSKATGAGGKIIKPAEAAEAVRKAASIQKKIVNSGAASPQQMETVLAQARTPVEALSKRQAKKEFANDPAAMELYQRIVKERATGPKFKRKGSAETQHFGRKVAGLPTVAKDLDGAAINGDAAVKEALETLGDQAASRNFDEALKSELKILDHGATKHGGYTADPEQYLKLGMKETYHTALKENAATLAKAKAATNARMAEAGLDAKTLRLELAEATLRNLSPEISKQFKVRLGKWSTGVAGTEKVGQLTAKIRHGRLENTFDHFNKTFRAMAKVNPALGQLRNQQLGVSSDRIRSQLTVAEAVWNGMPAAARTSVLKDFQAPGPNGSMIEAGVDPTWGKVDNAVEYFDTQLKNLQAQADELGITPDEMGAWINDPKMKISAKEAGWKFNPKTGKVDSKSAPANWLYQYVKNNKQLTDPGQTLFQLTAAMEHSLAKRTVQWNAAEQFGVPARKFVAGDGFVPGTGHQGQVGDSLAHRLGRDLENSGYVRMEIPGKGDFLFHPEIAEGMTKVQAIMNDRKTMDGFLKLVDEGNQLFKSVVTRYNPSFHTRTVMSEMMLGYIGGMRQPLKSYKLSTQIMRGRNKEYGSDLISPAFTEAYPQGRRQIEAANTLTTGNGVGRVSREAASQASDGHHVVLRHKVLGNLTKDQVWGLYKTTGLKTGFATTDVARSVNPTRKMNVARKVNDKLQNRFEDVEDWGRLAHFVDELQHSKHKTLQEAVDAAAQTVLKYHLDYTAVTQFENTWATRAMPFYKWVRLSTPMIVESLMHNPGKAMVAPKTLASMSEMAGYDVEGYGIAPGGADLMVPGWLKDAGSLPMLNTFGDNQYFNPAQTVPLYGVLAEGNRVEGEEGEPGIKSAAMSVFSKLTPLARTPVELATDVSAVGAPPSSNYMRYALGQAPQTSTGGRISGATDDGGRNNIEQILAFLANPGFQPLTQARMNSEAQRQKDLAQVHRRAVKKRVEAKQEEQK